MPIPAAGGSGPVAIWITAAQWAVAARRIWGPTWILTPEGTLSAEEALARATDPTLSPTPRGSWRRHVPEVGVTAFKDLREMVRARQFRQVVLESPLKSADPAFVWQHHHTFHDAGRELARRLNKPLVQFVDAPQVWEAKRWGVGRPGWGRLLETFGERPQLVAADLVACVSEEVADAVRALGVSAHRILVTPTGVDPDLFSPDISGVELRDRLGLSNKFIVGWVGSFRPFHGLPMALKAIRQLQTSLPDVALLLVGDGQERLRIRQLAQALGVASVVFTGTVPYHEMATYIAAMDVALLLDEGKLDYHYSPLKLKEYMASGRAVVAARVGEVGRILSDGVDALVVDRGNHEALALAIERLYHRPELRGRLAAAARQRAVRDWTWERQVRTVQRAIDHLAASRREG